MADPRNGKPAWTRVDRFMTWKEAKDDSRYKHWGKGSFNIMVWLQFCDDNNVDYIQDNLSEIWRQFKEYAGDKI